MAIDLTSPSNPTLSIEIEDGYYIPEPDFSDLERECRAFGIRFEVIGSLLFEIDDDFPI